MMTDPTGSQLLARGVQQLRDAGVPDPAIDARKLFSHALRIAPGRLTLVLPEPVDLEAQAVFAALLQRRAGREPVSHLTGTRMFYGRDFAVSRDVLDPRPETEILVEAALRQRFARVLDLGTGSGCILLTLLAEMPGATGIGTDISDRACAMARKNVCTLGLLDRAEILLSDWTHALDADQNFDLIVSNPPYIALSEMAGLAPEVREFEPHLALTDGADGLEAYRHIVAIAPAFLKPLGRLMVEIGPTQARQVFGLFDQAGIEQIDVIKDMDGRDRVVSGAMPQA